MKRYGLLGKFPSGITILSTTVSPGARDTSAPVYQRAYINRASAGNNVLELEFDSTVTSPSTNYELGFTVECRIATGLWKTLSALKYTGTVSGSYIVFTFDSGSVKTFQGSHEIRVSYDQALGDITDEAGNSLESFTNVATLTNSSTVDLLTGIVEVWHMLDESAAISSANDMTNTNSVVADAKLGSGMQMSRTGPKYLSHTDSAVFSRQDTNFTWSFWIKVDTISIWQYPIAKWHWDGPTDAEYMVYVEQSANKVHWIKRDSDDNNKSVMFDTALATDTWYNIIAYHDADNNFIGININDGALVSDGVNMDTGIRDGSLRISFGSSADGNAAGAVAGIMDEIALHSKVLSTLEVTDLYNSGAGKAYPYIPDTVVFYSSGEIGVVDSSTVEIAFTENVDTTSDYTTGVTIKVGTVTATIESATRQTDQSKVRYVLGAGVDGTEAVTWEYLDSSGGIESTLGIQLGDVSAQTLTNTAFEPEDLAGTVHWWHVRPSLRNGITEGDGVAVSTWTEDAGVETFTQTLTARPTLQTNEINDLSVLRFDGIDDYMLSDLTLTEIFAADAKTAWFVIKINTMGPSSTWYLQDTILTDDDGGYWGAAVDADEIVQGNYTGSNQRAASSAYIDTVYVVEMRHESGTIYTSLNGGPETSTVSGSTHTISNSLKIGANFASPTPAVFFDGDIAEIVTSNQAESSANRTKMRNVLMSIYFYMYDTFTGTKGTALTAHTPNKSPAPWVLQDSPDDSDIQIQTNRARIEGDGINNIATIESGISDCYITATIRYAGGVGTTSTDGVVLRYEDADNYYWIGPVANINKFRIIKREGGSNSIPSEATGITISVDTDYTITINADGTSIVAELNGANQLTYTDSVHTTETKHGINGYRGGSQQPQFDNFEVTKI